MRAEYGAEHPFWTERGELVDEEVSRCPWMTYVAESANGRRICGTSTWRCQKLKHAPRGRELHQEVTVALGRRFEVRYDDQGGAPGGAPEVVAARPRSHTIAWGSLRYGFQPPAGGSALADLF